jgi:transcriptional regulator with XRE-family HTH domain
MNAIDSDRDGVDPEEWERPAMRAALAARDITRVYRLLQKIGFSQQKIAALTGQSQPEVSAIIHGRKVMAYDVLARIADGLGAPRAYMGLSFDGPSVGSAESSKGCHRCATTSMGVADGAAESEEDDPVQRRDFIGAAAAVAVGANAPALERWLPRPVEPQTSAAARIGAADVEQIRVATHQLHELEQRLGGGSALDAITGYLRWASGLLRASCTDMIGRQLRVALADLYSVAGSSLHDMGRHREANRHCMQGLVLARDAEERGLVAALLWRMGRVSLHREHAADALRFFQLAQMAAQDAGSHAELARLHANEAWAYALLGQPKQVADALARADHERSRMVADREAFTFHGAARYEASFKEDAALYRAKAHWILARGNDDPSTTRDAELAASISARLLAADGRAGRNRAFDQTILAGSLLRSGEHDAGMAAAHTAVDRVEAIRSVSAVDELAHVATATKAWPRDRDAIHLRRRIAAVQAG